MPKKDEKAVVKKEEAALPISMEEMEAFSGMGFEGADKDSFAIPFLRILQPTSPQIDEEGPAYVDGAKAGMFLNTVTDQLLGKAITIIPIHYTRDFVEWQPNRGGFVKSHGNDPAVLQRIVSIDDNNNSILDNGNTIQDTRNHFVLIAEMPELGPIILSLTSTGIRHSKKWMSLMTALRIPNSSKAAPMFAGVWTIETVRNSNDDGTWYQLGDKNVTGINFDKWVTKEQLDFALAARELVTSGEAQADYDSTIEKKNKNGGAPRTGDQSEYPDIEPGGEEKGDGTGTNTPF